MGQVQDGAGFEGGCAAYSGQSAGGPVEGADNAQAALHLKRSTIQIELAPTGVRKMSRCQQR